MAISIEYQSRNFPTPYGVRSGTLHRSWDDLLWAALTVGRPSIYHVFRYGPASFHEALFRLSLMRMALQGGAFGPLRRTDAFSALDPTEKGMVSYFLGMALCKLFAWRLLQMPWLLHLDVFRPILNPTLLGRSRPDLVGDDNRGRWHAFESKGRSSVPSQDDKTKAKNQALRVVSVGGRRCSLHVGSFAYFKSDELHFYWRDPEPVPEEPIRLPAPKEEWRHYYAPAFSLISETKDAALLEARGSADITVEVHLKLIDSLNVGRWAEARLTAKALAGQLQDEGYQPDGLRVVAGESWLMERL